MERFSRITNVGLCSQITNTGVNGVKWVFPSSRDRLTLAMYQILHSGFHYRRAETYKEIQSLESVVLMYQILDDPKHYEHHIQRFFIQVIDDCFST